MSLDNEAIKKAFKKNEKYCSGPRGGATRAKTGIVRVDVSVLNYSVITVIVIILFGYLSIIVNL